MGHISFIYFDVKLSWNFKCICTISSGTQVIQEENVAMMEEIVQAVGQGSIDNYVRNLLESNSHVLGTLVR